MLSAQDRLDLIDLVIRVDACASARDVDGYAALFTEDAVMTGVKGSSAGSGSIRRAVSDVWRAEGTGIQHVTTMVLVEGVDASGTATVSSTLLLVRRNPAALVDVVSISQKARKVGAGWLISERTIR